MTRWNPQTWSELVQRYQGPLTMYASQRCLHPEDAVQEAFLELFRLPDSPDNLSAWLFTVVRNKSYSSRRAEQRRGRHETEHAQSQSSLFEESLDNAFDAHEISGFIRELPEEQREVLILRLWGELSFDDISELTEITRSTCHRRYQEALESLRKKAGISCPNTNL